MLARHQLKTGSSPFPLVFLHGFWGCSHDWLPVASHLPFTSFGFDLPGHGDSPFTPHFTSLLKEALLPISPLHLVGYSMGGRLALAFTAKHPDLVQSLTLIGAHPGLTSVEAKRERLAQDQVLAQKILTEPIDELLREWYDRPLFGNLRHRLNMVEMRQHQNREGLAQALLEFSLARQPDFSPLVSSAHLLVGEEDLPYRRLYESWNPQIIPNTSHAAHLEAPEAVANVLRGLL